MSSEASSSGFNLVGVDDVEDFDWANEGELPDAMSWELFSHLFDLMQIGNNAFRQNRMEEAINYYSRAHSVKPADPVIMNNRCLAYLRISQFLKHRSPLASEDKPLSGLDPTIHAGLALKDAEKLMNERSNSVTSYIFKANALILLDKYEEAHDVILSGLQIDPLSNPLQTLVKMTAGTMRRARVRPQRTDDFDCTVCLKLLYEPVTTSCGHTFCRSCLLQAMDQGNRCPLCRTVLFISSRTCAISVSLNSIIQRNFPEEYAERKSEHESLINMGPDLLPLFVMDVILPCQIIKLNIFEARYRLMVRRMMEGNRRMGMVINDPTTRSVVEYACEVEITECEPLPDGRLYLEVQSRRRCRIRRDWNQDGYRVAEVEWVQDIFPPEGSRERVDLQETTDRTAAYALSWIRQAHAAAQGDEARIAQLFKAEGLMPTTRDPERFSFWLVSLTNQRPPEKLTLLSLTDTKERLRRGFLYMRAEEQRWQ